MRRRISSVCFGLVLLQILLTVPNVSSEVGYTPQELSIEVYSDGIVDLLYKLETDPTLLSVNVSLVGETYENILMRDQDGILLDYRLHDGYTEIDVLGSQSVEIEYTASDLTNKTGSMWTLMFVAPVNVYIQLPERSTIIYLEPIPIEISILEDTVGLTMPEGFVEISYILGVVGTKEHALALIDEAEAIIDEINNEGIVTTQADALLSQAIDAYNEGQYMQSEHYAEQCKDEAIDTRNEAIEASLALENAQSSIDTAEEAGRTTLLDLARDELLMAQTSYASGNYEESKQQAEQAGQTAQNSEKPSFTIPTYLIVVFGVGLVGAILFLSRKQMKPRKEEIYQVDLEKVFSQRDHLRMDEKEVLKFIANSKEGVFVSELRKRYDMPKSSAWRMIRRLEEDGLIITKSIGRETFVQMNPEVM